MKKLFFITAILAASMMVYGQTSVDRAMSPWARDIVNANVTTSFANIALRAPIATPTFTGTVTVPILTAEGAASFEDDVSMDSTLTVAFAASFEDDVTLDSTLTVDLGATFGDDVTMDSTLTVLGISQTPTVIEYTTIVTVDSTKIVGTAAGDIGHADGAILVAAPGTGSTLEFVSAFIIYDHATADFAGGNNDAVIQVGVTGTQVAMSSAITDASLLTASGDKMLRLGSIATELVYADNGVISLYGTAFTNDGGTVAGLLRVHITYRVHTTGL